MDGGTVSHTFTILNTGDGDLSLTGDPYVAVFTTNPGDFTVTAQPSSPVAPFTGSTTFTVQFNPSEGGTASATITIDNNDSDENPYAFTVQGAGTVAAEIDVQGNSISIPDGDERPLHQR